MQRQSRFLIVKLSALGDIVQSFPVLDYLKDYFPGCFISWAVDEKAFSLVNAHPLVDKTLPVSFKKIKEKPFSSSSWDCLRKLSHEKNDVLFDLQGNIKSGIVAFYTDAKTKVGFSWRSLAEFPSGFSTNRKIDCPKNLPARERYLRLVMRYFQKEETFRQRPVKLKVSQEEERQWISLNDHFGPNTILVCHGSTWENKKLAENSLISVLNYISEHSPCKIVMASGSLAEKEEALAISQKLFQKVKVLEPMPFSLFQRAMRRSSGVIAMDSFALHLAGSANTSAFGFFGPSKAVIYAPEKSVFFQGKCPYGLSFEVRCPKLRSCKTGACLKDVSILESFIHSGWLPKIVSVQR